MHCTWHMSKLYIFIDSFSAKVLQHAHYIIIWILLLFSFLPRFALAAIPATCLWFWFLNHRLFCCLRKPWQLAYKVSPVQFKLGMCDHFIIPWNIVVIRLLLFPSAVFFFSPCDWALVPPPSQPKTWNRALCPLCWSLVLVPHFWQDWGGPYLERQVSSFVPIYMI